MIVFVLGSLYGDKIDLSCLLLYKYLRRDDVIFVFDVMLLYMWLCWNWDINIFYFGEILILFGV